MSRTHYQPPPSVVAFDLDGTLCPTTTVCKHLGKRLGHSEAIERLEEQYADGKLSNRRVAELDALAYKDRTLDELQALVVQLPLIRNLPHCLRVIRASGTHILLCSVTGSFATSPLASEYGFDSSCGTDMEFVGGRSTGRVLRHFDEHDKATFVWNYCDENALDIAKAVAIGDARSDIPLFGLVGLAVALNATPTARECAHVAIDSDDLASVLPIILG